jgi:uncharacterized Fe-S cluster protein YjdI
MAKREYTNGELTVLWDSDKCGHCELCWRELPSVFNPEARPWVSMAGGPTDQESSPEMPNTGFVYRRGGNRWRVSSTKANQLY